MRAFVLMILASIGAAGAALWIELRPLPAVLAPPHAPIKKVQLLDREGAALSVTYANGWNTNDQTALYAVPELMQRAFVLSEDKRFFDHNGVDWRARAHALLVNVRGARVLRGASTISEQVVRILHPRRRSVWARIVEGIEAQQLERRFPKNEILEFYLNQVPYGRQLRGVVQAARGYFDRDLSTLSPKEVIALVVMVRAPGRLDPFKASLDAVAGIEVRTQELADRLLRHGVISTADAAEITAMPLEFRPHAVGVHAEHFVQFAHSLVGAHVASRMRTSLDGELQQLVERLLNERVRELRSRGVTDGAVLVLDNLSGEVLAWVNAGSFSATQAGSQIDAVRARRQPGSALKPFVYALALERGWSASTVLHDTPLFEPVGTGLHAFRNYSRIHYGPIRLREALGNSLNVPAIRAAQFVGRQELLRTLQMLGMKGLTQHSDFYGDGLALGDAEVSLLELVQGYAALARGGELRALRVFAGGSAPAGEEEPPTRVFSPQTAAIIADILADPSARRREFGSSALLRFPLPTAVKTGTSSDYRDAWALGFTHRFTVGVWMGDLNRTAMKEVSGSVGPALVLRAVFHELERRGGEGVKQDGVGLTKVQICAESGLRARPSCPVVDELFAPGSVPTHLCALHSAARESREPAPQSGLSAVRISLPTPGLRLAMDPRISDEREAFPFEIAPVEKHGSVEWLVDGVSIGQSSLPRGRFLWRLRKGSHQVSAIIEHDQQRIEAEPVRFEVR